MLIFDPTACTSRTRRVVPAGTTTGIGGGGGAVSTGGAGAAVAAGASGDPGEAGEEDGAPADGAAEGEGAAGAFDAVCEELVSDEAGDDEVLLQAVHQTTRLRSNVDGSTVLVRIETSFQ
jgi:hypothetical protein